MCSLLLKSSRLLISLCLSLSLSLSLSMHIYIYIYICTYVYKQICQPCISYPMQAVIKAARGKTNQKVKNECIKTPKPNKHAIRRPRLDSTALEYRFAIAKPRFYGSVTIYTTHVEKAWRVKPGPGRRDEKRFNFTTTPRVQWSELVKHVKSLQQAP